MGFRLALDGIGQIHLGPCNQEPIDADESHFGCCGWIEHGDLCVSDADDDHRMRAADLSRGQHVPAIPGLVQDW